MLKIVLTLILLVLPVPVEANQDLSNQLLNRVNQERSTLGKPQLRLDSQLSNAASRRASEIITLFDHVRPNGQEWFTVYDEFNIFTLYIGENIAKKSFNYEPSNKELADEFFRMWKNSPGHYQNMIKTEHTVIGIAMRKEGNVYHMVQLFNSEQKKPEKKPETNSPKLSTSSPSKDTKTDQSENNPAKDHSGDSNVSKDQNSQQDVFDLDVKNDESELLQEQEALKDEIKQEVKKEVKEELNKKDQEIYYLRLQQAKKSEHKEDSLKNKVSYLILILFAVVGLLIYRFKHNHHQ